MVSATLIHQDDKHEIGRVAGTPMYAVVIVLLSELPLELELPLDNEVVDLKGKAISDFSRSSMGITSMVILQY